MHNNLNKQQMLIKIILHPIKFMTHFIKQSRREKFKNKRTANVILVSIKKIIGENI
jgi:hypothetical protein